MYLKQGDRFTRSHKGLLLLPLFVVVLCLALVLLFSILCPSSVAITLQVNWSLYFNCHPDALGPYCSVALTQGAVGWCAVCDCDIS